MLVRKQFRNFCAPPVPSSWLDEADIVVYTIYALYTILYDYYLKQLGLGEGRLIHGRPGVHKVGVLFLAVLSVTGAVLCWPCHGQEGGWTWYLPEVFLRQNIWLGGQPTVSSAENAYGSPQLCLFLENNKKDSLCLCILCCIVPLISVEGCGPL